MSRFGIQKEMINPSLGAPFIGYHRQDGIEAVHDSLYVTASIFESKQTTSVFVSIDNIGMLIADTDVIREGIANRLSVTKKQVTVIYTHTHSGPATAGDEAEQKSNRTAIYNATALFSLIPNVDQVNVTIEDSSYHFTKQQLRDWYGKDFTAYDNEKALKAFTKPYIEDEQKVKEIIK